VNSDLEKYKQTEGSTCVVASTIVTGRSLLSVSQALRLIQTNGLIQYLVGVARTQSTERLEEIQKNIQYGKFGAGTYDLQIVNTISLPDRRPSPWTEERRFLVKAKDSFRSRTEFSAIAEARLQDLEATEGTGLRSHLFWDRPDGTELRLRPNFAFWSFNYGNRSVSQADIYFTIAAILHEFRRQHRIGVEDRLQHHRIVLSPRNFDRFNDGIIQAAILRASRPSELDYSVNEDLSFDMLRILQFLLSGGLNDDRSEAIFEFMLAIALGKLRLHRKHEATLMERIQELKAGSAKLSFLQAAAQL
jgi:hypothetical protein